MIKAYRCDGTAVVLLPSDAPTDLDPDTVWLDLLHPDKTEERLAEGLLGMPLPTRDDLKDIEPSSRLYADDHGVYMTASLICRADTAQPELTDIAFILGAGRLVTVRYGEPRSFQLFTAALQRNACQIAPVGGNGAAASPGNGISTLARLLETVVDRTAEILEVAGSRLDRLASEVFVDRKTAKRRPPHFLEDRLVDIANQHRLLGKVRDSLASLSRLVAFVMALDSVKAQPDALALCAVVAHDVQSLSEHAGFVGNNISFMLDASLGLINVEQNAIIKIFSIASVVFLPPTLVASVYGMNFELMPELKWAMGYPFALILMAVSAVVPFLFFRWKGWL